MRFACGARYTSARLVKYLLRRVKRGGSAAESNAESKLQFRDALL
jgi:hypothetical protein